MKNSNLGQTLPIFFILALCWAMPGKLLGQDWARKMFPETSHDFGNVTKGEVPEYRFEIQNIYEEDIHIAQVFSSCGCTSVSLSKNVLKTWEKGEVICRFNSPSFDGFKQATVTVRLDKPYVGEMQLTVQGNIVRGLTFNPDSIDFGQVSESNLPAKTIKMASTGSPNFRIVDVKSTFSHIKVQLRETGRNNNLVNYEMTTQLKPTVPAGFTQGELYVVIEENRVQRQIPIKFSAKVVSALQIPDSVTMGAVSPGEEVKKKVILKHDRPFKITDVTCHSSAFRVKADRETKKVHFVELIYTGEDEPGRHECELSFFIDNASESAGKIKAVVEIIPVEKPSAKTADAN
jgi:hypothetical protein